MSLSPNSKLGPYEIKSTLGVGGMGEVYRAHDSRQTLFSLDPITLKKKTIKELEDDFAPTSEFGPGYRFSLAPDGKSFVYSTARNRNDLWMLTGYRQPGLWNQIKAAFQFGKPN